MNLNKAFAYRLTQLLNEKRLSKYRLEKESGITHSALRYIFNEVNKDVKTVPSEAGWCCLFICR